MNIDLPDYAEELFFPYRYKVLYGGRGSSKSWTVARALLIKGKQKKTRILCAREFQNSINESVHRLLVEQIWLLGLQNFYTVTNNRIIGKNGTDFFFKGLHMNIESVKSTEGVDILWLEEGQTVSKTSWEILIPTIRKENSEIWVTYNPVNEDDPTQLKFVDDRGEPLTNIPSSYIKKVNWKDNPWFGDILETERKYMMETDPDLADHIWEGGCRKNSAAQIFRGKWTFEDYEIQPHHQGPYQGADFGFSTDPSTLIQMWIDPHAKELLIRREAWGLHVDTVDLPRMYKDSVPNYKERMTHGDCSRPETISYLNKEGGIPMDGAKKWKGSVEDGVDFIKSFRKIRIHIDCPRMADEARNYSFKVDKLTGEVLRTIVDKHNHCWDAVRYGLDGMITASGSGILDVL